MSSRSFALTLTLATFAGGARTSDAQVFNGGMPAGFTCIGNCGAGVANGVVPLAPLGGTQFGWISTFGGPTMNVLGVPDVLGGGVTNGSLLTSGTFTASAGQALSFRFNYVTSDGGPYNDFAFVRLLQDGFAPLVLFSARTEPNGNTVPGQDLPGIAAGVSLQPSSTVVVPGAPDFAPLGDSFNNQCYDVGCGWTGWIRALYVIPTGGTYQLQFGVNNFLDEVWDSALAIDYALGAGETPEAPADDQSSVVPEPSTWLLTACGLALLGAAARRRPV